MGRLFIDVIMRPDVDRDQLLVVNQKLDGQPVTERD